MRWSLLVCACLCSSVGCRDRSAASAAPLTVGIGVDTTTSPRREIFSAWRAYIEHGPDRFDRSPHWSAAEQARWPIFDIASAWIYYSAPSYPRAVPTLVGIDPAIPGREAIRDTFVVRALYTTVDRKTGTSLPVGVTRTYAFQEGDRWVLAGALPRLTADWPRVRLGSITFIHTPAHQFDSARATRSTMFVDSLARAFAVEPPGSIDYFVVDRPEELARIIGVDLALPQTSNGRAVPANHMVLSGLPVYGEWYPHELSHLVLGEWLATHGASSTMDEGMAHWLGGSTGRSFAELMRELNQEMLARPRSLDSLLGPGHRTDSLANRAAAALLALANDRGGVAAVKAVLTPVTTPAGPDHVAAAARVLGLDRLALDEAWRAFARRAAGAASQRAVAERVAQDTVSRTWRHEVGVDSVRLHGDTNVVWISPRNWMATDAPQAGVRVAPTGRVVSIQWIMGG